MAVAVTAKRVNAFQLASKYLNTLGWPNTVITRRVLAAWFMAESARVPGSATDIYVKGNNPLNISCRSCSNYWLAGGTHKIIVFPSETAGASAFKTLINSGGPGYSGVGKAFKVPDNSASNLVLAINNTGWVRGSPPSYIINGTNKLKQIYNQLAGDTSGEGINYPLSPNTTFNSTQSGIMQFLGTNDPNHVITAADIEKMIPVYQKANGGGTTEWWRTELNNRFLGKKISDIQTDLFGSVTTDPFGPGGSLQPIKTVGDVLAYISDPQHWLAALAVIAGAGFFAFGMFTIGKEISSGSGSQIIDVTPIIIRE